MPYTAKYVIKHFCSVGQFSDKMYAGITNESGVDLLSCRNLDTDTCLRVLTNDKKREAAICYGSFPKTLCMYKS